MISTCFSNCGYDLYQPAQLQIGYIRITKNRMSEVWLPYCIDGLSRLSHDMVYINSQLSPISPELFEPSHIKSRHTGRIVGQETVTVSLHKRVSCRVLDFYFSRKPYGPGREKTCLRALQTTKALTSLISAFVIRYLESIISKLATSEISLF